MAAKFRSSDVELSKEAPKKEGSFTRLPSQFRNFISSEEGARYPPEAGRYHLYISHACPWAHRTAIVRKLKGLEHVISLSVVDWMMGSEGWTFGRGGGEETKDPIHGASTLREIYRMVLNDPNYQGKVTVPVLFDKQTNTIVNNESSEIIRMLNSEFNQFAKNPELDLYPENLRPVIDEVNSWVYPNINDGVYRCGFAQTQEAYEDAFIKLFEHLDKADKILGTQRYLAGSQLTEADIRLFTTLIRFDAVYVTHFKCNGKFLIQYENLRDFVREIYQIPGIAGTVNFEHIKNHYYQSHTAINPRQIVPIGPFHATSDEFWKQPHNRDKKFT